MKRTALVACFISANAYAQPYDVYAFPRVLSLGHTLAFFEKHLLGK